jgi:hypothetical protein
MNELVEEMGKYKIDTCISTVQEIRWSGKGTVVKENYRMDAKLTDTNLEQDFVSVDMLLVLYLFLNQ